MYAFRLHSLERVHTALRITAAGQSTTFRQNFVTAEMRQKKNYQIFVTAEMNQKKMISKMIEGGFSVLSKFPYKRTESRVDQPVEELHMVLRTDVLLNFV